MWKKEKTIAKASFNNHYCLFCSHSAPPLVDNFRQSFPSGLGEFSELRLPQANLATNLIWQYNYIRLYFQCRGSGWSWAVRLELFNCIVSHSLVTPLRLDMAFDYMRVSIFSWNFCFKNCCFTKVMIELYLWCLGVFAEYRDIWHSWPYSAGCLFFPAFYSM